jgi:hypothetical protein
MKIRTEWKTTLPNSCFITVAEHVKRNGGEMVLGWMVEDVFDNDQRPYLKEKVHHAVWKHPDGNLIDITPQATSIQDLGGGRMAFECDHRDEVEFEPDPSATILIIDGKPCPRASKTVAVDKRAVGVAESMSRAEKCALLGEMDKARYYTEKANARAHRKGVHARTPEPYEMHKRGVE